MRGGNRRYYSDNSLELNNWQTYILQVKGSGQSKNNRLRKLKQKKNFKIATR